MFDHIPLYALTNQSKMYGASAVFYPNVLESFGRRIGKDFYVLPSSVHEMMLVPTAANMTPDDLKSIVEDANRTVVSAEECLSDHVYFYDRAKAKLKILL